MRPFAATSASPECVEELSWCTRLVMAANEHLVNPLPHIFLQVANHHQVVVQAVLLL
jgi:hypothetical protein